MSFKKTIAYSVWIEDKGMLVKKNSNGDKILTRYIFLSKRARSLISYIQATKPDTRKRKLLHEGLKYYIGNTVCTRYWQ